jgi:hypothetical protein
MIFKNRNTLFFSCLGILIVLLFCIPSVSAENIAPFVMPSARSSGMGGTHAALADDFYSLFTNPAAFVGIEEQFSAAELTLKTYGPIFEILDVVANDPSSMEDIDISGIVGEGGFAAGLELGGPLSLGWVGRGLGLGIFNRLKADASVFGFSLLPELSGDIILTAGYSFRVLKKTNHIVDAGFLGKGFYRMSIDLESSIFKIDELANSFEERPISVVLGLGFDLGVKYTFAENFSAAVVCLDAYSPAMVSIYDSWNTFKDKGEPTENKYATVLPRLGVGLKYRIRSALLDKYISNFIVMADYRDFLDLASIIPRNPILNVGIGTELVVLDKLSLRFGVSDALPAMGFGLDLTFMQLDFAIYGRELGLDRLCY